MVSGHHHTKGIFNRIALISAPWPLFSRPSIQLGALKAYLKSVSPDITVSCHHFFLSLAKAIGYPVYQALSRKTWVAESVYAALLYPERQDRISRFFAVQAKKTRELAGLDFPDLTRRVKIVSDAFVQKTDWGRMDLAGFSVCLCQLTASLYFVRQIKRLAPNLPLIVGGSITGGCITEDLWTAFPEIDLIVIGEGEQPLARLVDHFQAGGRCDDLGPTPGIIRRKDGRSQNSISFCQLPDLQALPIPEFTEYFELLSTFPEHKRFFPTLPVEISRGCWWRAFNPDIPNHEQTKGCAFCNLNLQWQGYRTKAVDQVVNEIDRLTDQHRVLSVAFMDNVLPPKKSRTIFDSLTHKSKAFQFLAELRATTTRRTPALSR